MDNRSKKITVLIIDDSAFMRKIISNSLNEDELIEVVDTARNGKEGLAKALSLKPDIITLDVEMPIMDGLSALPELMKITPTPKVIMFSSQTYSGAEATIRALELGAVDFITKNSASALNFDIERTKSELIKKIKEVSKTKVFDNNHIAFTPWRPQKEKNTMTKQSVDGKVKYIIAIGTSTGGPRSLQEVIPLLPGNIPAAVLIVQHMPPGFTKSLAARLDSLSDINVKEAEDGDIIKNGWAYLAPGDYHMLLHKHGYEDYKITINQNPPVTGHRPSVNAMMDSVASCNHNNTIAVMMTGMGNDGSEGIKKIKNNGGKTIAQNEETCVVYGMPKSAVNAGAIDKIVPLKDIANEILRFMGV